jgi:hypothetical protein
VGTAVISNLESNEGENMKGGEYCYRCGGRLPLIVEHGEKVEIRGNTFKSCDCKIPKLSRKRKTK